MRHMPKMRNSSVELLRIISMLMVVAHHFVVHNLDNAWDISDDGSRFVIAVFAAPLGKISIVSFFAVTAWFLCEKRSIAFAPHSNAHGKWNLKSCFMHGECAYYSSYSADKTSMHQQS